ncbi:DNA phosphorothioation-associated putative methyltransferase [Pseudoalteromonas tunicata]|uniref:DNA phosphorothioation-associated putative methyltransferase n=1 Tax=Pseudoalteromonas tunicata TaxID=314281 RepID=UPI00273E0454|nr:DNA phosphorothioation-associated putative methyltransferase [Pseudoalteromonas tunicata]MDP5213388.1 DNA phosphorothioation-associated putative methyltransferase [Pseudoalteromonas tunicata]
MNFPEYKALIKSLSIGKKLPAAVYLHQSAINEALPDQLTQFINNVIKSLEISSPWNLIKFYKRDFKITLLHYPDFDHYAYPELKHSTTIDLIEMRYKNTDYSESINPPILHRKETFVLSNYSHIGQFKAITLEGETIGLYQNTKTIGFKQAWLKLIKQKGHSLDEFGRLIENEIPTIQALTENLALTTKIKRHLTAINRDRLSAPFQRLAKHGYLNGDYTILDYGCGLQDDLRELEAHGLDINGWDPVHFPDGQKKPSDIVNLGFVLNVIENQDERKEALLKAYQLAEKLLVVSVMLTNETRLEQFKPFKDGVITKWNTFQKYYSQSQIKEYIETILNQSSVTLGQGIIAIFKDKQLEEHHHLEKQYNSLDWQHITVRPKISAKPQQTAPSLLEKHHSLLESFWQHCLHYGRIPSNDEFELSEQIRKHFSSHNKAFSISYDLFDFGQFEQAQQKRKDDLLVYFALSLFGKRQAKSHLPARLIRDIKNQFNSFNDALTQAQTLLFSVNQTQLIGQACYDAFEYFNIGELNDNHSYIFPATLLNKMPSIIRLYVGCATQLYGDLDAIDLIKVHMRSGKVTLLKYDNFNKPLPLLTERIKIRLIDLDIDFFFYGDQFPYQPLYNRINFIACNDKSYKKQQTFDSKLASMLKSVPKTEWPNWPILLKVFDYWKVELKGWLFTGIK